MTLSIEESFKDLMDAAFFAAGVASSERRDAFLFGNVVGAIYPICTNPMNNLKEVTANVARAASGLFRGYTAVIVGCALNAVFDFGRKSNDFAYVAGSLLVGSVFLNRCAAALDNKVNEYFRSARA